MNFAHPKLSPWLAAALFFIGAAQAGQLRTQALEGLALTPEGQRNVRLLVECQPDDNGSLALKLLVPDAYPAKQRFDFEAFEGPEPEAGDAKLTLLAVAGPAGRHELRTDIGGWYSAEEPGGFVFATKQYGHFRKDIADLAVAATQGPATFTWTQEGYVDRTAKIAAGFAIDAPTAKRLHDAVAACLARTANSRRTAKH